MSLLCLDAGGTTIKYALCDQEGNLSSQGKAPTPRDSFDSFAAAVKGIAEQFRASGVALEGAAVSMPGRLDSKTGYCYSGGYLYYNAERAVGPELSQLLGLPVVLANDAKAAGRAELWKGALQGVSSGAVVVLGTGLGGCMVVEGKVVAGPTGAAGELSFLPVDLSSDLTVETIGTNLLSATGLLIQAAKAYGLPYSLDYAKGFELPMDGEELFRRVAAGEAPALKALKHYGECFGRLAVSLASFLDVDKIAIGGGISAQDSLIEAIRAGVKQVFDNYPLDPVYMAIHAPEIEACHFRNGANLIGAAHCFYEVQGHAV